jgi:hypothetical protein
MVTEDNAAVKKSTKKDAMILEILTLTCARLAGRATASMLLTRTAIILETRTPNFLKKRDRS